MSVNGLYVSKLSGRVGSFNGPAVIQDMTGTNGVFPGTAGLVPAPQPGDETKFLRGDGTFASQILYNNFVGTNGVNPGAAGLVPAPQPGDETKFLRGDGTFAPGGTTLVFTVGPEPYHDYTNIQAAVNAAQAVPATSTTPIRIEVAAGTYAGFNVSNSYISIVGAGEEATIVNSSVQINNVGLIAGFRIDAAVTCGDGSAAVLRNCYVNNSFSTGQTLAGIYVLENVYATPLQVAGGLNVTIRGCRGNLQLIHLGPLTSEPIRIVGGDLDSVYIGPRPSWGTAQIDMDGVKVRGQLLVDDTYGNINTPVININNCVLGRESGPHGFRCGTVRLRGTTFVQAMGVSNTCLFQASNTTFLDSIFSGQDHLLSNCTVNGNVTIQADSSNPNMWMEGVVVNGNMTQTAGNSINRYSSCTFNGTVTRSGPGLNPRFSMCMFQSSLIYSGGAEILDCTIRGNVLWNTSVSSATTMLGTTLYLGTFTFNVPGTSAELYIAGNIFHNNLIPIINAQLAPVSSIFTLPKTMSSSTRRSFSPLTPISPTIFTIVVTAKSPRGDI